jgi:flagellar assembly protein FliH
MTFTTPQSMSAYSFRQLDAVAAPGEDTLTAALAEADAIREAARAQGAAEGRREAEAAVHAEAAARLTLLTDARDALEELREELCAQLEADAVLVGLRLAEQIVAGTIEVEPERLTEIAGLALRRLADRRSVTLVVNPGDLELLSETTERLSGELGGIEQLHVQADRRVGRGGVIARTDEGEIDATVDAQISRAREIVALELSQSRENA